MSTPKQPPDERPPIRVMPERPTRGRTPARPALPVPPKVTPPGQAREYPPDPPGPIPGHDE